MSLTMKERPHLQELLDAAEAGDAAACAALDAIECVLGNVAGSSQRMVDDWECAFADNAAMWARGDGEEDPRWAPVLNARYPRRKRRRVKQR